MTLTQNTCVFLFFSNLPRPPPPRSLMSYIEKRVIQCSPYGLSADVYSFGICMWEVFQGTKCDFLSAAEICNRKKSIRPSIPISYFDDDDNNDNDDVVNQTQGLDSAASTNDANIKRNTTVANTTKTAAAAARSSSSKNKNKKKYIGIGMPKQLQNLMQQCWNDNSNERPTFNEISSKLNLILLELFYYHYSNNNQKQQPQQQQQSSSSLSRSSPSSSYVPASTAYQKSNNEEDEDHVGRSAAKSIAVSNSVYNSDKSNNRNYATATSTSSSRRRIKNTKSLPRGGGGGGQGGEAATSAFWYRLEMIHSSGLLDV